VYITSLFISRDHNFQQSTFYTGTYNCLQLSADELEGQSVSPVLSTSSRGNAAVHGASGFRRARSDESGKLSVIISLYIE